MTAKPANIARPTRTKLVRCVCGHVVETRRAYPHVVVVHDHGAFADACQTACERLHHSDCDALCHAIQEARASRMRKPTGGQSGRRSSDRKPVTRP